MHTFTHVQVYTQFSHRQVDTIGHQSRAVRGLSGRLAHDPRFVEAVLKTTYIIAGSPSMSNAAAGTAASDCSLHRRGALVDTL